MLVCLMEPHLRDIPSAFLLALSVVPRYFTDMRITAPLVILACALIAASFSFLSDDGLAKLSSLLRSLELQQRANLKLEDNVQSLKRQVVGLQNDPRTVEKAARSELGMARSDELVVVFEKKEQGSGTDR